MKKFIIPLMAVVIVVALLLGCMPGPEAPPVTPPPVTPPVTPPPVTPPPAPPEAPPEELPGWGPMKGVAVKPDGTSYEIASALFFLGNEYGLIGKEWFESLVKRAGGRGMAFNPNADAPAQVALLEDFLAIKPDAVVVHAIDGAAVAPMVDRLAATGIPVFSHDSGIPSESITTFVTFSSEELGAVAGAHLVKLQQELGKPVTVYVLWGPKECPIFPLRHKGFSDAIRGYPIEMVEGPDCLTVAALATDAVMDAFPAHPEFNAIWEMGCMGAGAVEGLRAIGKLYPAGDPGHIFIVALDESSDVLPHVRNSYIDGVASHCPVRENDVVMKALFTYVCCGQSVPREIVLRSYIITPENADDPLLYGNIIAQGTPWDEVPVFEFPPEEIGGLVTPTAAMKLAGY